MKRLLLQFLVAVIFVWAVPANSAIVIYDGDYVTGINGIDVSGVNYDVDFIYDSYNSIWSSGTPEFWNDVTGAGNAASSINAALNGEAGLVNIIDASGDYYYVPFQENADNSNRIDNRYNDNSEFGWGTRATLWTNKADDKYYATFSSVPIPGAIWLLGSALIGLMGFRKKFRE